MTYSGPSPTPHTEALLLSAEANLVARRTSDADQLVIAREWALSYRVGPGDLREHGVTNTREIGAIGLRIWEYAPAELALVWQMHPLGAQRLMANAVDLHDRMPGAWAAVTEGRLPAWVACKLARLTAKLPHDCARLVDEELLDDYESLSPGRLLGAAEGRVAAADPGQLDDRVTEARRQHEVHVSRPVNGTAAIFARCDAVDAARLFEACDTIAELLEENSGDQDRATRGQLRARALGILADPQAAVDLLHGRDPRRGKAVVYVHMTPRMLDERLLGIARVEDIGPHTREMLRDLIGHDHISLKPVLDLADAPASDAYEVPGGVAEYVHLIKPADVFPWAESTGRTVDLDHTVPWPRGRTTTDNLGKMVRRHHRIKTHATGWHVDQLAGDRYVWRTPHGRYAVVDRHGTHAVTIKQPTVLEQRLLQTCASTSR